MGRKRGILRFFSTFTGIGGFDLGLERAKWQCVGQCELEPFCNAVLEKHWPDVWRWNDVKTLTGQLVSGHCGRIDALVGGPPCQPSSVAGQRRGAADDRWLWPDFLRMVSEIGPMWVLAENPRGVLSIDVEGLQFGEWIAGEFANRGYSLMPVELAAEDVGAPHRRERVWFVAMRHGQHGRTECDSANESRAEWQTRYELERDGDGQAITASDGWIERRPESEGQQGRLDAAIGGPNVAHPNSANRRAAAQRRNEFDRSNAGREEAPGGFEFRGEAVADAQGVGEREPHDETGAVARQGTRQSFSGRSNGVGVGQADSNGARSQEHSRERSDTREELAPVIRTGWPARPGEPQHEWEEPRVIEAQSQVGSSVNGISARLAGRRRVAALKALGNAVVPQCAEVLGRMINRLEAA